MTALAIAGVAPIVPGLADALDAQRIDGRRRDGAAHDVIGDIAGAAVSRSP